MQYLLAMAVFLTSCSGSICKGMETRCANNVVEVCDEKGQWLTAIDCNDVDPGEWTCVFDGTDHTCVEVEI